MTAYELASLHAQVGQTINAQLANWLAILTVYLGAGYLVAHRMALSSAIVVSAIAVIALASYAVEISRVMYTFVGVSVEIGKLASSGGGLEWHQAVGLPAFQIEWFSTNSLVFLWVMTIAGVYFFFSSRYQNRKATSPTL